MKKKVLFYILAVCMLCFGGCQNKGQADEPAPISIMAITAAIPMMMPSMVSMVLVGLRKSERRAIMTVLKNFIVTRLLQKGRKRFVRRSYR